MDFGWVAGIMGYNGWLADCFFFFFSPFQHVDLSGWWNAGVWFFFNLLVVWVVSGVVVG